MKQRINILKKIKDKSLSWLAKKKREYSVNIVINETEDITRIDRNTTYHKTPHVPSPARLLVTPGNVAHQAAVSMEFSRQE